MYDLIDSRGSKSPVLLRCVMNGWIWADISRLFRNLETDEDFDIFLKPEFVRFENTQIIPIRPVLTDVWRSRHASSILTEILILDEKGSSPTLLNTAIITVPSGNDPMKVLIATQYPSDFLVKLGFSFQQRGYSEIYCSPLSTAER